MTMAKKHDDSAASDSPSAEAPSGGAKKATGARSSGQGPVDISHVSVRDRDDLDDFDYDGVIEKAEDTDNPDGYKYQVAVQLAQNMAGPDIDDADMRDLVDSEFAKLNPTATGAQMRGEDNLGAMMMGGFNEAKDNVSDAVGHGIDSLWDGLVGGGAGVLGGIVGAVTGDEDTGSDWNEFVSGLIGDEDGAIFDTRTLGDIATGIAVSAIPGIGVPLSAGMALIDNSDNIREAIEGRDSISRQNLDADERLTKLGSTAIDTVLAAAPGMGKLRNATAARSLDDVLSSTDDLAEMAKGISEASTIGRSLAPSNVAAIARDSARGMPARISARIGEVGNAIKNGDGAVGKIGDAITAARTPTRQALQDSTLRDAVASLRSGGELATKVDELAKAGAKGAADSSGRLGRAARALKGYIIPNGPKDAFVNALSSGAMGAAGLGNGIMNYAAETNQNPFEAMGNALPAITENNGGDIGSVLRSLAVPIGANALMGANRLPGFGGRASSVNSPLRYAQMGAGGEIGSRAGQSSYPDKTDVDDLARWIDTFSGQ